MWVNEAQAEGEHQPPRWGFIAATPGKRLTLKVLPTSPLHRISPGPSSYHELVLSKFQDRTCHVFHSSENPQPKYSGVW